MEPLLIVLVLVALAVSVAAIVMPSSTRRTEERRARREAQLANELGAWR